MISWWGPILYESYGGTEAGILCQINSEEWLDHPGSVGRPLPGIFAKAIGEHGRDFQPGEIGILHFRYSTGLLPRYRGRPPPVRPRPGLMATSLSVRSGTWTAMATCSSPTAAPIWCSRAV